MAPFVDAYTVQDCSNSTANALELLQSCTKPSIWTTMMASLGLDDELHVIHPSPKYCLTMIIILCIAPIL